MTVGELRAILKDLPDETWVTSSATDSFDYGPELDFTYYDKSVKKPDVVAEVLDDGRLYIHCQ